MNHSTWLYIHHPGVYTVGFYDPSGKWHPESDHTTAEPAAKRVHWLNGGRHSSDAETIANLRRDLQALTERVDQSDARQRR